MEENNPLKMLYRRVYLNTRIVRGKIKEANNLQVQIQIESNLRLWHTKVRDPMGYKISLNSTRCYKLPVIDKQI